MTLTEQMKILNNLKADLRAADTVKKEWDVQREQWFNETYGKPYGNEVDGRSKIVSKDIKKQLEWLIPSIADPFLNTPDVIKARPITFEDVASARQNELLLNTQFTRKFHRYNFINKVTKILATEGTAIIRTGWDYEDEEVEQLVQAVVIDPATGLETVIEVEDTVINVVKNQPTAIVCRNEDVYIDPTCKDDIDKCQFIIHRFESDLSTLKSEGLYKNLDKIKDDGQGAGDDYDPEDDTRYSFEDKPRKKLLVYEYWGNYDINNDGIVEPIVCVWVGNTIIRLEENPYPDKKPPFVVAPFSSIPFQMFGEALAETIGDNQKVKTAITRGIVDNMAKSNNGQIGLKKGSLDQTNRARFLKGKNFEFNGMPTDFWQGSYNQLPASVFQMMELMNNDIEAQTGTRAFGPGSNTTSLGHSNTRSGGPDSTAVRRAHLVRNIAENIVKPVIRKWMAYNAEFLEEEEIIRVTNEEYVPVRRDDLSGRIDIDIDINTMEDNMSKAQELAFLMQTLGNTLPFEATKLLMARIVKLSRMPDLEQMLMELQPPQPDPLDQQIKQLQVAKLQSEIEKNKADVQDKLARAGENEVDRELKLAKARVEEAKARKLGSDADLADLRFLKDDNQHDEAVKARELERAHEQLIELLYLQKELGGKDEQINIRKG